MKRNCVFACVFAALFFFWGNLLQAQAITWQEWTPDLFAKAKKEHKLVILDLEAIWCHWCHVMEETTYKNKEVQKLIAEHFIAVRVDQDSRPDLSIRYQDYGWPATVFFNADGKEIVIRKGYIPPEKMTYLIKSIIEDPSPIERNDETPVLNSSGSALSEELKAELLRRNFASYDKVNGGWGTVHKFLDWDAVEFCISQLKDAKPDEYKEYEQMAKETLEGGIHLIDPVWGGVYQYSTDGDWVHPHFEKIMQMQAENLRIYSLAYALWRDPAYLKAAQDIRRFLETFLKSNENSGAFYTSMDADLHQGEHAGEYFALDDAGRRKEGLPRIDKHIYARENGWAINALVAYYKATGDKKTLDEAIEITNWVIANRSLGSAGSINSGGFSHDKNDKAGPYLGDNLAMGRALLSLYEATGDRSWLQKAQSTAEFIAKHFISKDSVGVFTSQTANDSAGFKPIVEIDENVMVARWANMMFRYTGNEKNKKLAETAMSYLSAPEVAKSRSMMVAGILLADKEINSEPPHVVIVGAKNDPLAQQLYAAALGAGKTYLRLEWYDRAERPLPNSDIEYPVLESAAAFTCADGACSLPLYTPESILKKLNRSTSTHKK